MRASLVIDTRLLTLMWLLAVLFSLTAATLAGGRPQAGQLRSRLAGKRSPVCRSFMMCSSSWAAVNGCALFLGSHS